MKLFETWRRTARCPADWRKVHAQESHRLRGLRGDLGLLKVVFGLFGLVLGLLGTVLWLAFWGFLIYLVLKVFAPGTAARVREMVTGH